MRDADGAGADAGPATGTVVTTRGGEAPPPAVRRYRSWALLFLGGTVVSGAWLRATLVQPDLLAGVHFGDAVHAHSHLAFFGWIAMALFGLMSAEVLRECRGLEDSRGRRGEAGEGPLARHLHLHGAAVALASAGAFVAFLRSGYSPPSMALAGLHVVLWVGFAALVWRALSAVAPPTRSFYRASLAFLVVAGAGTLAPAFVMLRRMPGAWVDELSIGLFLVPFLAGFTTLGVMGAVYRRLGGGTAHRRVLTLIAIGVAPSVLAYPGSPAPAAWIEVVGRVGLALVGAGVALFGIDVVRALVRRGEAHGFLGLSGASAALAGSLEVLLAFGVGTGVAHRRPIVIAFLHLLLLGFVSPALLHALGVTGLGAPRRTVLYAGGLALMLATLAATGVNPLLEGLARRGVGFDDLMVAALVGGGGVAVSVIASVAPRPQRSNPFTSSTSSSARPVVAYRTTPPSSTT